MLNWTVNACQGEFRTREKSYEGPAVKREGANPSIQPGTGIYFPDLVTVSQAIPAALPVNVVERFWREALEA